MACNASGDMKVPLCSNRGRVALSNILLRKCARRHGCACFLSSHKSITAECVLKWRGSCDISDYLCEGRISSHAQTYACFVVGFSCFPCHSDWVLGLEEFKKPLWKYAYWSRGLICPVRFSSLPGVKDRAVDLPLSRVHMDLKQLPAISGSPG